MTLLKQQIGWLFLCVIAATGFGWYLSNSKPSAHIDDEALAHTADAVITQLRVRQFNAEGQLVNYMESETMQHIPATNINYFTAPRIIINEEKEGRWEIRSQKAQAADKGERITFIKEVSIHQDEDAKSKESTFKTEELTYFPKQKFATTAYAVVFEQAGSIVKSTGMNAYLENKHVELLGKTHAVYTPNKA